MENFIWTSEYSVGVEMIDEQHKHFFEIANRLRDLVREENATREALTVLFGDLGNYAMYHLGTEESFFHEMNYEDAAPHIAAHNAYRTMIAEHFTAKISNPDVDLKQLAVELADYSETWLQTHILTMDKQYTEFFHQHGLT